MKVNINISTFLVSVTLNHFLNSVENVNSQSNYLEGYCAILPCIVSSQKMAEIDFVFLDDLRMMPEAFPHQVLILLGFIKPS